MAAMMTRADPSMACATGLDGLASWLAISRCVLGGVRTAATPMLRSPNMGPRLSAVGKGKRAANAAITRSPRPAKRR